MEEWKYSRMVFNTEKKKKNGPRKILGRQPLENLKGYLPQILIGPFLNTLPQIYGLPF